MGGAASALKAAMRPLQRPGRSFNHSWRAICSGPYGPPGATWVSRSRPACSASPSTLEMVPKNSFGGASEASGALTDLWCLRCLCFDAACGASTSAAASELASELNASEEDSREDGSFCELTCFWVVWLGPSPLAFFSASCRSLTCCRASLCLATRSASAADRGVAGLFLKSSSGFSAKSGEDLLGVSFRGDALSAFSSSWLSFMMVVADILQVANV